MESAPQPPQFNFVEDYPQERFTFAGLTGTLAELRDGCDYAKNADLDAINKFAARIINKNSGQVKPEHMPYIQEVVESRGEELRVTVKQEQKTEMSDKHPDYEADRAKAEPVKENKPSDSYVHVNEGESRQKDEEVANDPMLVVEQPARDRQDRSTAFDPEPSFPDEETTLQMDAWLAQLQREYAAYEGKLHAGAPGVEEVQNQDADESIETAEPAAVVKQNSKSQDIIVVKPKLTEIVQEESNKLRETHNTESTLLELTPKIDAAASTADNSDSLGEPISEGKTDSEDIFFEAAATQLLVDEREGELVEDSEMIHLEDLVHDQTEMQDWPRIDIEEVHTESNLLTLDELIPEGEAAPSSEEPVSLMGQIQEYLASEDEIEVKAVEEANLLIDEIESIVDEIVELQNMTDIENIAVPEELEEKLKEVAIKLFDTLGISYDQETLRRFVHTVLEQGAAQKEDTAPETEEMILDEGTHELKIFTLQDFIHSVDLKIPNFHLLGRFAIWQNKVLEST